MFCKYCGYQIDDDSVFCSHCGEKLQTQLTESFVNSATYSNQNCPPIIYKIAGKEVSNAEFSTRLLMLNRKEIKRTLIYSDGHLEPEVWDGNNLSIDSNLVNNIRSNNKVRNWKNNGISKIIVEIPEE